MPRPRRVGPYGREDGTPWRCGVAVHLRRPADRRCHGPATPRGVSVTLSAGAATAVRVPRARPVVAWRILRRGERHRLRRRHGAHGVRGDQGGASRLRVASTRRPPARSIRAARARGRRRSPASTTKRASDLLSQQRATPRSPAAPATRKSVVGCATLAPGHCARGRVRKPVTLDLAATPRATSPSRACLTRRRRRDRARAARGPGDCPHDPRSGCSTRSAVGERTDGRFDRGGAKCSRCEWLPTRRRRRGARHTTRGGLARGGGAPGSPSRCR